MMTSAISPDMTMAQLLEQFPGARRALFAKYHIGGCSSCGFQPTETIAEVCARNENLPVTEVIDHLEASAENDRALLIEPKELAETLKSDAAARLIDLRTREEYDTVRVAESHFFTQSLMQEIMAKWDRNALITFMDHQGTKSLDAAAYFAGHGFTNARSLRGGIDAWSCEVDPAVPRYQLE